MNKAKVKDVIKKVYAGLQELVDEGAITATDKARLGPEIIKTIFEKESIKLS